ncbi:unnamed protein product [Dibothriocephalus latus]|uniref:Fibronectin type-III domain-containing protein n=1 Tax=Dibothriocephalus latus TaxID=60516 RepID=A0A3P7LPE9_DIBLA|nr:unnamed protein product [Dibothriocephalus latus]
MLRWKSNTNESSKSFRVLLNDAPYSDFEDSVENKMYFTEITDLMPNTVYQAMVIICPSNEKDLTKCEQFSKPSASASTYPKAPEEFTAEAVDSTAIKFAWTLPNQTFEHLLVVVRASAPDSAGVSKVDPSLNTTTVKGLNALTYYDTTMSVENTYDAKTVASENVLKVLTAPNPPTAEVTHVGDTWMRVSLVPAAAGENLNLTYTVIISNLSGYKAECTPDEQLSCDFDGLEKGTEYSLVTKACYDKLCSVESQPFNATTGNTRE